MNFRPFRRVPVLVLLVTALTALVAGCAGPGAGRTVSSAGGDAREASLDAELSVGQIGAPTSLDPHLIRNPSTDLAYIFPLYDMLLQLDTEQVVAPMLATSWEVAPDGRALTLQLRGDATFQDGSGFDSAVVKANLDRAKTLPGSTSAPLLSTVTSVDTDGPQTVRISFSEPAFNFPVTLATQPGISAMISGQAIAEGTDISRNPAGSGPFRLVQLGQDRLSLERNDDYWDPENMAKVKRATVISLSDDTARIAALQSGQISLAPLPGHLANTYQSLLDSGRFTKTEFAPGSVYGSYVNISRPELNDVRVRKALSMAIDRNEMNQAVLGGAGQPAFQFYPPGTAGHVDALEQDPYDPAGAKRLLEEAGVPNLTFNMIITGSEPSQTLATIAQAQLARVGVTVNLQRVTGVEARSTFRRGASDGYTSGFVATGDPSIWAADTVLGADSPGGVPPEVEKATAAALQLQLDDPARPAAFERMSAALADDPVHLLFLRIPVNFVGSSQLMGVDSMTYGQWGSVINLRSLSVAEAVAG
ncbi:ABC transporter substrate-binding protein [Rhodococcus sp. NPDC059968]|uniref:ABC transporter substrate-binding protein n=1 Tax=Rhodococcus sp. NPDC059968 TaxID=3347017 RepID=UPI00366A7824